MKPQLIVAIPGIRTPQTASAWQEHFSAYIDEREDDGGPRIYTLEKQYWAGTFPIINHFVINPFLARTLAKEIVSNYLKPEFAWKVEAPDVSFIVHSNGADVAIQTIELLAKWGHGTRAAVFIAGAVNPDARANGINKLVADGMLGAVFAYSSESDQVLGKIPALLLWPYGRAGCEGFTHVENAARVRMRWFEDFDHGTYFWPDHEQQTFAQAIADIVTS